MLDIKNMLLSLRQKRERDFISILEFLDFLKNQNPNVSYSEIATFLLIQLAPHDIRKTDEELWGSEDFERWEDENGIKVFNVPQAIDENPTAIYPQLFFEALETVRNNPEGFDFLREYKNNKDCAECYLVDSQQDIFIDRAQIENILGIKTINEDELNQKYDNERVIAISMALTKTEEFVKNTDINKSPTGLAERVVYENRLTEKNKRIDELQTRIAELESQNIKLSEQLSKTTETVQEYDGDIPLNTDRDKLANTFKLIIENSIFIEMNDGKFPTYSKLHTMLNAIYSTNKEVEIPSKNTLKKYLEP